MSMHWSIRVVCLTIVASTLSIPAAGQQRYLSLPSFRLLNGSTLEHAVLGYRTAGTLAPGRDNAVLVPTWLGGTSTDLMSLLGAKALVDTTKFFAVLVDAFGDGISSSPSNTPSLDTFPPPLVTIADMVVAERDLLDSLHVPVLAAVVGGSMGGMQALEWAVRFPTDARSVVAYVGTPRCASADRILWEAELQAIADGVHAGLSDSAIAARVAMINMLAIRTPEYQVRTTPPDSTDAAIRAYVGAFQRRFHANDWAMQARAILSQDVARQFHDNMDTAFARITAPMLLVISMQDHMVNPGPALALAHCIHAQTLILNNDCGHLAPSCEFERFSRIVREFLDRIPDD